MRNRNFDADLVHLLRVDGRLSVKQLAAQLELPRSVVSNRMTRLMESGALRVVAALDPEFAGHKLLTHSLVRVSGASEPVTTRLREMPQTVFVSAIAGGSDIAFEARFGEESQLTAMLAEVRKVPDVQRIITSTYIDVVKGFFVANYRGSVTIDDTDRGLIVLLEEDGRATYRELAETVGISPSTARERVTRLLEANVISISAVEARGVRRSQLGVGVGITASGGGDDAEIVDFLARTRSVDFAARSYGRYDFIATLVAPTPRDLHVELDQLRALAAVSEVDAWSHLNVVKENYGRALRPASFEDAAG